MGILSNPAASHSMRYINVHTMRTMINTVKRKTVIFARLALSEFRRSELAEVYLQSLNTLNKRKSLSARSIMRLCHATIKLRKLGRIARKSIIPKKLKINFLGSFDTRIRRIYSILNNIVIIHWEITRYHVYVFSMDHTLLSITIITLRNTKTSKISSNSIPALVSVLKIIRCNLFLFMGVYKNRSIVSIVALRCLVKFYIGIGRLVEQI